MRWGERDYHASLVKEGMDREYVDWLVNFCRLAASPGAAAHYMRMVQETDVSDIVAAVHVPALVFYGSYGDGRLGPRAAGVRALFRNAQMVRVSEFASPWHVPELIPELRRFLADHERGDVPDSVLTTLLFTDIVRSTERTAAVGDRAWRDLLAAHQQATRREIARFRGRELDTAGDGFFALFDGPARAIKCAQKIVSAADRAPAFRYAQASTPASANSWATRSPVSQSAWERESPPRPTTERFSYQPQSKTSSQVPVSSSNHAAFES